MNIQDLTAATIPVAERLQLWVGLPKPRLQWLESLATVPIDPSAEKGTLFIRFEDDQYKFATMGEYGDGYMIASLELSEFAGFEVEFENAVNHYDALPALAQLVMKQTAVLKRDVKRHSYSVDFDEGMWYASVVGKPGCMTWADTPIEALSELITLEEEWDELAEEDGYVHRAHRS